MRAWPDGNTLTIFSAERFPVLRTRRFRYAASVLLVAFTAALLLLFTTGLGAPALLPFVAAVAIASFFGTGPAAMAVVSAVVLYDFFFIPPVYRFSLDYELIVAAGCLVVSAALSHTAERAFTRSGRDQKIRLLAHALLDSQPAPPNPRNSLALGRLDGCVEGDLYGWALDPDDPLRPQKVTLYVNERPAAESLAVHYRPDVGPHCFYFDLSTIIDAEKETKVDVRFEDGRLLPNAPLAVGVSKLQTPCHRQTVLFLHISKTAGTAFREAIAENYKQSEIAYIYPDVPGMLCGELNALPLEQRRGFRLVAGHFQYGIHGFFPQEAQYVTIVRDPVARIISEHRYLMERHGAEPDSSSAAASLIAALERQSSLNLDNLLVRCFSGVNERDLPPGKVSRDTFELALEHLRRGFAFVGHQERLAEAYESLRHKFGWKPRPAFERVNVTRFGNASEYEMARTAIEEYNRWDLKLYAEICRLFPT